MTKETPTVGTNFTAAQTLERKLVVVPGLGQGASGGAFFTEPGDDFAMVADKDGNVCAFFPHHS